MGSSQSRSAVVALAVATAALTPEVHAIGWSVSSKLAFAPRPTALAFRGGASSESDSAVLDPPSTAETNEPSLDDKVYAAMKKLGISTPGEEDKNQECKDGVCPMPERSAEGPSGSASEEAASNAAPTENIDPHDLAAKLAKEFDVDSRLTMAAVGATSTFGPKNERVFNEQAARGMIQAELDLISSIDKDSPQVHALESEGHDPFLARRALAFAENNMEDARAILAADKLDEEEDAATNSASSATVAPAKSKESSKAPDMVAVKSNFDPTALPMTAPKKNPMAGLSPSKPAGAPKPASKESVVFEATTAQIQELVMESPVPVLLDVYADWCGPCKVLGPALEEMAIKSGGMFRLVKVNSDNERPVSGALEVKALPTVFGFRDGKIIHMFEGMPQSQDAMQNFLMGLFGAATFKPPLTPDQKEKYEELTSKLVKTAGAACFSFSSREKLTDRITNKLDELVSDESVADVEASATLLRTLLSNVVKNPYDTKYRTIKLENKVIQAKIGRNPACLAILKSVGFGKSKSGSEMTLAKGKKVINIAPMVVARDCIDKWIQRNRAEMAAAARKRKDEADRERLRAEAEARGDEEEKLEEEPEPEIDPSACSLKLRLDGKKKVHDVTLHQDDSLSAVLGALLIDSDEEVTITCVAKRLIVKSSDTEAMSKTLAEHKLMPSAALVVKVGSGGSSEPTSSLKERAAKHTLKKGTHTMQSVGIYSKDDNNKAELIDGGGGVWYEHDVSDDEDEKGETEPETTPNSADEPAIDDDDDDGEVEK